MTDQNPTIYFLLLALFAMSALAFEEDWFREWRPRPRPKPTPKPTVKPPPPPAIDCSQFTNCFLCVNAKCAWSLDDISCFQCKAPEEKECTLDASNTSVLITDDSWKNDGSGCPKTFSTGNVLIHSGTSMEVKIETRGVINRHNLALSKFKCRTTIEDKQIEVKAELLYKWIRCDKIDFSYTSNKPTLITPIDVYGGRKDYHLQNPFFKVEIYKCEYMGWNCEWCMKSKPKYNCGWCEKSKRCTLTEFCEVNENNTWYKASPKVYCGK